MVDLDTLCVVVLEVPGDGVRAGVEPCGQLLAELEDLGDYFARGRPVRTSDDETSVRTQLLPQRCNGRSARRPRPWRRRRTSRPRWVRPSMMTAVMTSLAFDIPQASDQPDHRGRRRAVSVLDVLRHPVLDVLNLDTTPAIFFFFSILSTTCENGPLAANSRASGPFLLCPGVCHLVALWTAVSRCPRTHADGFGAPGRSVRTVGFSTDGHGRARRHRVSGSAGAADWVRLGRVIPRTRAAREGGALVMPSGW